MIEPRIIRDATEREAGLAYARRWRDANRAYFDALYGPRITRRTCAACNGRGHIKGAAS